MKPVHIISLSRCFERSEAMFRQFAETGVPYNTIEAVDGTKARDICDWEVDLEAFRKIYAREIRPGEIGCYASHLKALETIVSNGGYGIVMEDDVIITRDNVSEIETLIETCMRQMPSRWSILYPGNPLMWSGHEYAKTAYSGPTQGHTNKLVSGQPGDVKRLRKALLGTQCYLISEEFALHVITHWNTIYRPIDEVYRILCLDDRFQFFHSAAALWWCAPNFRVPSEIRN
jgi:GR25 family glycosyltransferase involved in LPS biosynthesis